MRTWILGLSFALIAGLGVGCATTKDYGRGKCREYKPWCLTGHRRCFTDKRGCRSCTCVTNKNRKNGPLASPPN